MDFNEFKLDLQAVLEKAKSIANIKRDIKIIEAKLPKIKLQGTLNSTSTRKELNTKLKTINPKVKIDADTTQAEKKIRKINQQKSNPTVTPTVDNSQVVSGVKQAQKETKTLWERFTNGILGINLIRMGIQEVTRAIRQAIVNVKELDAIKTNIQMVSGTSDSGVNAMMSGYNSMAKDLSSTTKDVAEAANEFLRMGESVASTNELIKSSQVLSKVGMIESAESASYLISSLKGYKIAAENSMDVVSKLTSVDLEAAVSAGGLAEALSKCANIADNSGISINRLIGYTATVGETTQKSMSEVGNSFQALLSRMNNIKIGRFIDDETGESLSDTEAVLNKLGIKLRDTEDSYRSFDNVLDDIGSRWKDLSKVEQNAISVAIAGTRQRENFEALMNNWGNALKYAETAANSAGSALERYGVYQDSIQAKTNELTAAIESLSTNVISEDLYSGIIEATTGVVEFIDKTNLLKGTLTGLAAMGVAKTIASIGTGFITAAKSTAQLTAAMALFDKGKNADNLRDIGEMCKGLSDKQLRLIMSTKGLKAADRELILEGKGVAESERQQTLTTLGFAAAEDKATISTFSLKGAFNSLRTVIAMNPIGVIITAVSVATMVFSGFSSAIEEVEQKAKDLGNTFGDTKSDIEAYKSQIEELHNTINDSNSSIEDVTTARQTLMSVQDELIDKFGTEKETIDLITDAINNQSEALDTFVQKKWQETKNEFNDSGFWNGIANWLQGYGTNIDRMKDEMEDVRQILSFSVNDFDSKEFLGLEQLMKERGWSYQGSLGGFVKYGNLKDVYSELLDIQTLAEDIKVPDYFLKDLTKDANKARETIENYGEVWDAYILNDRIFPDKDLADTWHEVNEAYSDYQEAFISGNQEAVDRALNTYTDLLSNVLNRSDVDESVKEYFRSMYPALQEEAEKWEFRTKILPEYDTHALNGKTKNDIMQMLQEDGMQYGEQTFNSMLKLASEYGIITGNNTEKINQLLDLLVEWGILQEGINKSADEYADQSIPATISSSIQQIATQLEPQFKKLGEAYQEIFKLDDNGKEKFSLDSIDNSMLEELRQTFAEIKEEVGVTFDSSKLDSFFDTLTNGNSTAEQVQQAFNDLATAYLYSTDTLEQLNSETADAIVLQLEEMGVQNAAEIVADELKAKTEELIVAKEYLAQTGQELASATDDEVNAFILEQIEAGNCGEALALLQLKKMLVNGTLLDTSTDINNVLALAQAAGIATDALTRLQGLKAAFDNAQATGNYGAMNAISAEMSNVKAQIETDIANFKPVEIQFDSTSAAKSASKAGKDAGDAFVSEFEEELKSLQGLRDRGVIDEAEYLQRLRALYTRYFADRKEYLNEFKKYEREYLEGMKSLYDSALNGITKLMSHQIDGYNEAKDAAVSALEEERDARLEVIETQKEQLEAEQDIIDKRIETKQEMIDSIQKEIDAMKEAREERQRQLNLQKAEYDLERAQNQRTILQYSEKDGLHYVTNAKAIREAQENVDDAKFDIDVAKKEKEIKLIEEQIDLLEKQKEAIQEQIDALDKQSEQIEKYYSKLISEQEKYWDSMIKNMEQQKSKWEELAEIQEIAEAYSAIEQVVGELGYSVQDILNGNTQAFEDFKSRYIAIMSDMNQNTSFQEGLEYASGVAKENFGSIVSDAQGAAQELSQTFSDGTFSQAITQGVSDGIVSAKQELDKMDQLGKDAGDGLLNGWDEKSNLFVEAAKQTAQDAVEAFAVGQDSHSPSEKYKGLAGDAIDGLLLGVEENKQAFIDTIRSLAEEGLLAFEEGFNFENSTLNTSFDGLKLLIKSVTEALGLGTEGTVGGLLGALDQLSKFSFSEDGIVKQFDNLKTAIDSVTSAISGGSESSGGEGQGGGSAKGNKAGGNGSEGKGESGGGNSLTGAIESMGENANKVIGEPEAEGDGTVIGEFGSMKTAVNGVTAAIGGGDSEGGESSGDESEGNLIESVTDLGTTTEEILGESGGDGVIGKFEELKQPIQEANEHVHGISDGLAAIDGQEVECTIKVHIETDGSLPAGISHATGTALDSMNLESAEYNAKYLGNAHIEGTALVSGNWAVQSDEQNALVGEVGRELIVRGGRFFTVGDNGAEMFDIKKGDIVFNHEQTEALLKNGHISGRGKAYADGTVGGGKLLTPDGIILEPYDPDKDNSYFSKIYKAWNARYGNIDKNVDDIQKTLSHHLAIEHSQKMNEEVNRFVNNSSSIVNNNKNVQPVVHQNVTISCPNVTNESGAENIQKELSTLSLKALQIDW